MTVTATLPAPAATVVPAAANGSTPGAAAGFADALQLLLAGPAPEESRQDPLDEPATEAGTPDAPQASVFVLAQAAPAQLALPATQQPAPLTVPTPAAGAAPAAAAAPAETTAPSPAGSGTVPVPMDSPTPGTAQAATPKAEALAAGAPAGTPAQAVSAAPVASGPAAVAPPQPRAMQAAQEAPTQQQQVAPATAVTGAVAAGEALAAFAVPQPARPARQPATPPQVLHPGAPVAAAVPGVMPAAVLDAPVAVQTAVAQALSAQPVSGQTPSVQPASPGRAAVPVAPAVPGSDDAPAFVPVAAPLPAPAPAPVATTVPAAPTVVPAGFTAQLAKPLFTLASAGTGEHTMSVQVNPDKLGPVTIQAHIGAGGIRIEMFAASADGRDVLRAALPDLKRDLAGAGISASLDLSSNSQSGSPQGGQDRESFTRRVATSNHAPINDRPLEVKDTSARTRPGPNGSETVLDVMA